MGWGAGDGLGLGLVPRCRREALASAALQTGGAKQQRSLKRTPLITLRFSKSCRLIVGAGGRTILEDEWGWGGEVAGGPAREPATETSGRMVAREESLLVIQAQSSAGSFAGCSNTWATCLKVRAKLICWALPPRHQLKLVKRSAESKAAYGPGASGDRGQGAFCQ